jgi:hypothetical protein
VGKLRNQIIRLALAALMMAALAPTTVMASAGELTSRSVTMSDSGGGAASTYTATFTLATSGQTLGSIKLEICDSPLSTGSCVNTGNSFNATFAGATFGSVTCAACNGGAWSLGGASGNSAYVTHTAAAVTGTPTVTVVLNGVTNPSAANVEFYVRISTYSDTTATTPAYPGTDFGGVALATTQPLTITGVMPESLVFCVGITVNSSCTTITGNTVDLGTFSPSSTNTGTSQMAVSTNAGSGYVITINGSTLMSGATPIPAMGTQTLNSAGCVVSCTSTIGTSQFGSNVVANTTPSVGVGVTPTGSGYNGAGFGGYNTADSFRFFSGDTVASSLQVSNGQTFTNSYMVNVAGSQAAGLYTTTMTYICTATF